MSNETDQISREEFQEANERVCEELRALGLYEKSIIVGMAYAELLRRKLFNVVAREPVSQ